MSYFEAWGWIFHGLLYSSSPLTYSVVLSLAFQNNVRLCSVQGPMAKCSSLLNQFQSGVTLVKCNWNPVRTTGFFFSVSSNVFNQGYDYLLKITVAPGSNFIARGPSLLLTLWKYTQQHGLVDHIKLGVWSSWFKSWLCVTLSQLWHCSPYHLLSV